MDYDECPVCGSNNLDEGFDSSGWTFTPGGSVANEDWDESPIITECLDCGWCDDDY